MWYGQYYVYGIYNSFASRPAAVDVHALLRLMHTSCRGCSRPAAVDACVLPAAVDVHALLLQVKILESDPPEVTAALPCIGPERQVSGTRTSKEECWQDRATGIHSGE